MATITTGNVPKALQGASPPKRKGAKRKPKPARKGK